MAGVMVFFEPDAQGAGGNLLFYCFDDNTYEELEEKLNNQPDDIIWKVYVEEIKPNSHCLFAKTKVDSLWKLR